MHNLKDILGNVDYEKKTSGQAWKFASEKRLYLIDTYLVIPFLPKDYEIKNEKNIKLI